MKDGERCVVILALVAEALGCEDEGAAQFIAIKGWMKGFAELANNHKCQNRKVVGDVGVCALEAVTEVVQPYKRLEADL